MQVNRQQIDIALVNSLYAVCVRHEFRISIYEVPDFFIICVEDMRTIDVQHDISLRITFRMAVSCNMRALIKNNG